MRYGYKYFFLVFFCPLFQGCEDDPNPLGRNIIPVRDSILTVEDHNIRMHVLTYDSAESSNTDYALLGAYHDTVFGFTSCSFMTQWLPAEYRDITGSISIIDSVVLTLAVKSASGPLTAYQELLIYPLISSFGNVNYSQTDVSGYYTEELITADNPVRFKISNSVLKVHLSKTWFATHLLSTGSGSNYSNLNTFLNFFHGFYFGLITNKDNQGGVVTFDLKNTGTKISVHYNSNQVYNYIVTDSCKRLNLFSHDYSTASFYSYLNDTNRAVEKGYIQAMSGVQCLVKFTNPIQWRSTPAILKAELIIPVEPPSVFGIPEQITATTLDNKGHPDLLPDDPFNTSTDYFNGILSNNEYRINVTKFVHACNLGKKKFAHLYLFPAIYKEFNNRYYLMYQSGGTGQAIIKPSGTAGGIRLEITYLKLTD